MGAGTGIGARTRESRASERNRLQRAGAIAELAEAAAALGGEAADEARRHVAELARLAHRVPGPHVVAGLAAARAFLAEEPDQLTAVEDALAATGTRFPVLHARLLLKGARAAPEPVRRRVAGRAAGRP